ncbi:conserved hypothetical protein [gamma proteobacterium HTCC5015]|nr:conserved hypothetical protein [gamma proteobacterium HTCC5015]
MIKDIVRSFTSLPLWVQIWLAAFLVPVNAAAFFLLDTWAGVATAIAAGLVVVCNGFLIARDRGLGKVLAIPHLLFWGPLECLLIARLLGIVGNGAPEGTEAVYIVMVLIMNGISLAFDVVDTVAWAKGDRTIPGHT